MRRLSITTAALLDSCLGRALLPNLDRGKTEAIVSLKGKGSRGLRASLFSKDPPVVDVDSRLWPGAQVQLVSVYTHLGGLIHCDALLKHELRHRRALAWQAFNKRHKKIFSSPIVAWADKVILFESLVMSVLFHGAGTWPTLASEDRQGLAATFQHMAFSMMRPHYTVESARRLGSERALALLGLPGLDTVLHLARLRHLASCVAVSSREFWALVHVEERWQQSVLSSLQWLKDLVCLPGDFTDLATFWRHWQALLVERPCAWKRLLKKAQAPVLQASGPTLSLQSDHWADEDARPVAEVESCLSLIGFDGSDLTDVELWRRLKLAFKCVCAATPRLRLTAEYCRAYLQTSDDWEDSLKCRLLDALEWIAHTDLTEWLVVSPETDGPAWNTFRDGHLILNFLEVAALAFPLTPVAVGHFVRVFVGPSEWCCRQTHDRNDSIGVSLEDCFRTLELGGTPDLLVDSLEETALVCHLHGWRGFLSEPSPCTPRKAFESLLTRETFLGDLIRLSLRLWGKGLPACLLFSSDFAATFAPLLEIEALEQGADAQGCFLRNRWVGW
ncbi:hypothetical protein AK812_SmicGene16833 [Symbiodinium microadriaticum]|uniref:Uncharacterized protein n=1 Tax=Symbiodinium microadriaticum TaxID=2951 RepID=A0A1Q9DZ86_SYMMI|nr:hypothetical protein AK812_SmicGene16833 [Symbiodinium microadriaticum]